MKSKEHQHPLQRKKKPSPGRNASIVPTPDIERDLHEFIVTLEPDVSERTKHEYTRITIQVLHARTPARRVHM